MRLLGQFFLGGVAVLAVSTCGGGGGDGGPPVITGVTIAGTDSTVILNGTRTLTAQVAPSGLQGVTYTWTSSNPLLAQVTSGSATTSVTGLGRGTVTVTVEASTGGAPVSANRQLRVRIGSVVLSPASPPSMASIDDTVRLTAEARDANNAAVPGVTFTWQTGNAAVASVATVNPTQADVVAEGNGSTTVTATGDGVSQGASITVAQVATALNIVQTDTTVDRIGAQFTPTVFAT